MTPAEQGDYVNRAKAMIDAHPLFDVPVSEWFEVCQGLCDLLALRASAPAPASPVEAATELRERLAALSHDQWSGWMRYLFSRCRPDGSKFNGACEIPDEWRERWRRQMNTPYQELTEQEKESDRKEADRMLAAVRAEEAQGDRTVKLGVVEFHPDAPLRERFYAVVNDLRDSGSIVDLWLLDIAKVLEEHGYTMTVTTRLPKPQPPEHRTVSEGDNAYGSYTHDEALVEIERLGQVCEQHLAEIARLTEQLRLAASPVEKTAGLDVSPLEDWWQDVDGYGTHIDDWLAQHQPLVAEDALIAAVRAEGAQSRAREVCQECGHDGSHYSRCSRIRSPLPPPEAR